jgi:hypothetical protein
LFAPWFSPTQSHLGGKEREKSKTPLMWIKGIHQASWAGAYVTGPATGDIHSASSLNPNGTTEQYGVIARAAGQIVSGKDYSLHIGGNGQWLIQPPHNLIAGTQAEHNIHDQPHVTLHELLCQPACNPADDDGCDPTHSSSSHRSSPRKRRTVRPCTLRPISG